MSSDIIIEEIFPTKEAVREIVRAVLKEQEKPAEDTEALRLAREEAERAAVAERNDREKIIMNRVLLQLTEIRTKIQTAAAVGQTECVVMQSPRIEMGAMPEGFAEVMQRVEKFLRKRGFNTTTHEIREENKFNSKMRVELRAYWK